MELLLLTIGILLIGVGAVFALVALLRGHHGSDRLPVILLAAGSVLFLMLMVMRVAEAGGIPSFTRFDAMTWYALALAGAYLIMRPRRFARGIAGLLLPYLTIVLLCGISALKMNAGTPPPNQGVWLTIHVVMGYAAYAVFSLASINAVAYLLQDRNLKRKQFGPVWEKLPSLESLDQVMSRLVGLAFLFFTIAVVSGFMLVRESGGGERWLTDPKVAAVTAAWILFAVLVHMRASADRHGRGVALLTVAGLAIVMFAFVGVHLMADTVHAFLQIRAGGGGP